MALGGANYSQMPPGSFISGQFPWSTLRPMRLVLATKKLMDVSLEPYSDSFAIEFIYSGERKGTEVSQSTNTHTISTPES